MPLNRGPIGALTVFSLNVLGFGAARAKIKAHKPHGFFGLFGLSVLLAMVLSQAPWANAQTTPSNPSNSSADSGSSSNLTNSNSAPTAVSSGTAGTDASSSAINTETAARAQTPLSPATPALSANSKTAPEDSIKSAKVATESPPKWTDLTASQQLALKPLNSLWSGITSAHKRKWIALVANFADLSAKDQEKLQQRMNQWASLSAQERAQARVIFAQVQQLSGDDRLSKWQAYQALEPSQKTQLAQSAQMLPNSAAISPAPIALRSVVSIHVLFSPSISSTRLEVDQLSSKTLLPPKVQAPAP